MLMFVVFQNSLLRQTIFLNTVKLSSLSLRQIFKPTSNENKTHIYCGNGKTRQIKYNLLSERFNLVTRKSVCRQD